MEIQDEISFTYPLINLCEESLNPETNNGGEFMTANGNNIETYITKLKETGMSSIDALKNVLSRCSMPELTSLIASSSSLAKELIQENEASVRVSLYVLADKELRKIKIWLLEDKLLPTEKLDPLSRNGLQERLRYLEDFQNKVTETVSPGVSSERD